MLCYAILCYVNLCYSILHCTYYRCLYTACPSWPCSNNPDVETEAKSQEYCGLLDINMSNTPFVDCIKVLPSEAEAMLNNCIYDICADHPDDAAKKESACEALADFAGKCENIGLFVDWRAVVRCGKKKKENIIITFFVFIYIYV